MTPQWREDAPPNLIELAVGKCLIGEMTHSKWAELGLMTGAKEAIDRHPRLLRSLSWNDDDYDGHVYELVPSLLGNKEAWGGKLPPRNRRLRFPHLDAVTDYLDLPAWLALNESSLFDRLFSDDGAEATLPDGTMLSAAEAASVRLGVTEMRRQVERIRRDYGSDPEAAIGQAKELVETTCKTILGVTGDTGETPDLPALIKQTQLHLGLDPTQVDDGVSARAAKRILGGVSSILNGAGELRNARGTGHGRSGTKLVDPALARMAVGVVLSTVVYLIEIWEQRSTETAVPVQLPPSSPSPIKVGSYYSHETFGEGQVLEATTTPHGVVLTVDFGHRIGQRRILLSK